MFNILLHYQYLTLISVDEYRMLEKMKYLFRCPAKKDRHKSNAAKISAALF